MKLHKLIYHTERFEFENVDDFTNYLNRRWNEGFEYVCSPSENHYTFKNISGTAPMVYVV